jgi:hypothetical protein
MSGGKQTNASVFGRKSGPGAKPVLASALSIVLIACAFLAVTTSLAQFVSAADPGHSAASISAGTFEAGDFAFQQNLTVSKYLTVNGTTLFVDALNERIGIGTTTPGSKLEVTGDIISKGTTWTLRTANAGMSWNAVTYGNGMFVAVGSGSNLVMTSPDGVNWTTHAGAVSNTWLGVTYGNGLFVAVADAGTNRVMTSPDGFKWTARPASDASGWRSIAYGNGTFVALADAGGTYHVMTSPDGTTWSNRTQSDASGWLSVAYGNGVFVAVAYTGTNLVMTSPDGITWTNRTAAQANAWRGVTYGNGLFAAVADGGTSMVMTSPDGITWTARNASDSGWWHAVTYGNGLFVATALSGTYRVMTSPDGITWTNRTAPQANWWYGVTYGNGVFVAVSNDGTNRVMTSGKPDYTVTPTNNIYQGGMSIFDNVGIGTASPTNKLTVIGDVNATVNVTTPTLCLSGNCQSAWPAYPGGGWTNTSTLVSLSNSQNNVSANTLYIDNSNGRVGLGMTSPATKLDVSGSARISGALSSPAFYESSDDGLVAYIPFSEGSGTTASDKSPSGSAVSLNTSPTWNTTGKFGNAMTFNGESQYGNITTSASTNVSMSAWINVADAGALENVVGGSGIYQYASVRSGKLQVYNGTTWVSTATALAAGQWNHIAMTFSGATSDMRLYVNGVLEANATSSYTDGTAATIAKYYGSDTRYFNGTIDELRLYSRVLTADEIRAQYLRGVGAQLPYANANTGNVGIGTVSPTQKLEVNGTLNVTNITLTTNCNDGEILKWASGVGKCGSDSGIGSESDPRWTGNYTACDANSKLYFNGRTLACGADQYNTTNQIFGVVNNGSFIATLNSSVTSWNSWAANYTACDSSSKLYFSGRSLACGADSGLGSESDTLATVTNRGATTANSTTFDSDGDGVTTIGGNLTVGAGTLYVDKAHGNVGIGSAAPDSKLYVDGGGAGYSSLRIGYNGTAVNYYNANTHYFRDANNVNTVTITNGYVGIGTTSPTQKLEVAGTLNVSNITLRTNCNDGEILKWASGVGTCGTDTGGSGAGWATNGNYVYNNTAAAMVGIGTSAPNKKLDVNGSISINSTAAQYLYFDRLGNTLDSELRFLTAGTGDWLLGERGLSESDFHLYSYGTGTDVVTVLRASGNVGIGTVSPSSMLDVNGTVTVEPTSAGISTVRTNSSNARMDFITDRDATNKISFNFADSVGNSSMVIMDSGNVGIGTTTNTVDRLTVKAPGTGNWGLSIRNSGDTQNVATMGTWSSDNAGLSLNLADGTRKVLLLASGDSYFTGGNVGIGTTGPQALFHINASGEVRVRLTTGASDTNARDWDIRTNNVAYGDMNFVQGASQGAAPTVSRLYINKDGNVGINTTNPQTALHLANGTIRVDGTPLLYLRGSSTGDKGRITLNHYGHTSFDMVVGDAADHTFSISPTGTSNAFVIQEAGNVGIGTTTPAKKLHVNESNANAVSSTTFWNYYFGGMEINNPSDTANTVAGISFTGGSARNALAAIGAIEESTSLEALAFFTGGSGRANTVPERMRIDSAGNVGIGTASPATKLHINGTSGTGSELRITSPSNTMGAISFYENAVAAWTINGTGANGNFYINDAYNGVNVITLKANTGNPMVGIGTTNPGAILDIGGASGTVHLELNATSNHLAFVDSAGGTPAYIYMNAADSNLRLYTSGADQMIIGNGRVGIGISPTNGKLHVATSTAGASIYSVASATSGANYGIDAEATGASATTNYGVYAAATAATTNYAIYVPNGFPGAGANNYAIYSASAAQNYLASNLTITDTLKSSTGNVVIQLG